MNVILDLIEVDGNAAALGDAYRVDVRIVVSEMPDAVKVPAGALLRHGADCAVYMIDNGRARLRLVEIGRRTAREAEVRSGLAEGDLVVLHPGDRIAEGTRVVERAAAGRPATP